MHYTFLKKYLKGQKFWIFFLAITIIGTTLVQIVSPLIISMFIDSTVVQKDNTSLLKLAIVYVGLSILNIILSVIITYLGQKIGWRASKGVRTKSWT